MLYYPSLITFIVPLGFNTIMTFFILIRELSNNHDFYTWFRTYHNVAAIFTFCSIVDVDSLTMINSKLAGLAAFDAPISPSTEHWILLATIWNFIIEDTCQLIIQIIYIFLSVNYEIIPFLNLVSASLLWICIVLGRSYHLFLYFKNRRRDQRRKVFMAEYTNLNNNGGGDNNGNGNEVLDIRSVEYVLAPPLEEVSPATIRPPSWWLNTDQQYSSRNIIPNNGVAGDGGNNGGRQNVARSDYQPLERRSSLYIGSFDDENEIGVAGPSTVYNRRGDSDGISYEMIGSEHDNTNENIGIGGYERVYDADRTSQDLENNREI
ncbi:hypothetical protein C1645_558438 [Glomus cerebriforme]|uniref:Uncharacterized protein n=1 Tax=Glomus cerebriforme TaxID=658196 RepID=A0A397TR01_9GLOM|nr:hypothetical protein C1645_558438 [Glomus cerebriforme]